MQQMLSLEVKTILDEQELESHSHVIMIHSIIC